MKRVSEKYGDPVGMKDAKGRSVRLGDEVTLRGKSGKYTVTSVARDRSFANGNGEEIALSPSNFRIVSETEELPDDMELLNEPESCDEEFYTIQNYRSQSDDQAQIEVDLLKKLEDSLT